MGFYADLIPAVAAATVSTSSASNGIHCAEYLEGQLFIFVTGLGSGGSRITPRFEVSFNGNIATGGRYVTLKTFATSIRATGLSIMTLMNIGKYGRIAWTLGGTGASVKFAAYLVGKG